MTDFFAPGLPAAITLSDRQQQILVLIADGLSNQAIAGRLRISANTVDHQTKRIYDTLGACNRAHAVAVGIRAGVIR
ncbi:helix-turn-helix domain-containing protein [Actinoplanes rectilineatus]|uniref:helix-turn-helix domain-containing protein n=1 Tax=Actinoplanes rectilineatus TaxID=113571 RepID=UPI00069687B7|nr:helix-turn-helix domain-containing protein [Actinoplanes rectilineatus]